MPRLPRINLEGAIYYVTSKSAQNQELFKDKADYKMYLELLAKYKAEHKFKLFSYCLLPDRLHLLIETSDDATISEIMHDLNSIYTKYFNGRYQQKGHLFEARFNSVLVEKAEYLLKMTRHIHEMPGDNFKDYPYSSYHIFITPETGSSAVDLAGEIQGVKEFLTNREDSNAYEKYCLQPDPKEIEHLKKSLKRNKVLGSEAFAAQVRNRIKEYTQTQKEELKVPSRRITGPVKVVIAMIGAFVIVATASSTYLYISKASLEHKYDELLQQKEAEFKEKTKFENRNPLGLTELEGTGWDIEMVPLPADQAKQTLKDSLHFKNGRVMSDYFFSRGFQATNYSKTTKDNGLIVWETIQSNPAGDSVSWRGEWQGDAMKGILSFHEAGRPAQDFSFFSVKWSYVHETK